MLHHFLRAKPRQPLYVATASAQTAGAGATLTINKPTGTIDGDVMIAWMDVANNSARTWTGDAGWTELVDSVGGKGARLAYKIASGEGASYTFTCSLATTTLAGAIVTWRASAVDAVGIGVGGTNPVAADSISAALGNSVLMAFYGVSATGATVTVPPAGMTPLFTYSGATGPSIFIYSQLVNAGATGTRSATFSSGTGSCGVMATIKPS